MITKVGSVGKAPARRVFRDFRLERKGFLNVITYLLEGKPRRWEMLHRGEASVVLPVDFARRELYLLSEFRPLRAFRAGRGLAWIERVLCDGCGPEATFEIDDQEGRLYEVVAGMIDGKETPLEAAMRELREESGLIVPPERFRALTPYFTSVGGSTEFTHPFIADLPEDHADGRTAPEGDGSEDMDVLLMSWDDAFGLLEAGRIETATVQNLLHQLKLIDLEAPDGRHLRP